jgi:hypothetical protein
MYKSLEVDVVDVVLGSRERGWEKCGGRYDLTANVYH